MPDNKRQHFVPKSILKRFACDTEGKQINLVNIARAKVIRGASLRDQCYRDYFYGDDLKLEKTIGYMEGQFGAFLSGIVQNNAIASDLPTTAELVTLIALQKSRTLLAEEEVNAMVDQMSKLMMFGQIDADVLKNAKIGIKNAAAFNVAQSLIVSPIMYDLKHFLLFNRTSTPFIISDNPVVHTNWFCHARLPGRSGAGIAKAGLQVVMPISPHHAIFLHDSNVYGADASSRVIDVSRQEEVDLLNELQWINAFKNIYFPAAWSEKKIQQALSWSRPEKMLPQLNRLSAVGDDRYAPSGRTIFDPPGADETRELIHFHGRELPKDIRLRRVTIRAKPRFWDNRSMASPQRDHVWDEIVNEFVSAVEQKKLKFNEFWLFASNHPLVGQVGWLRRTTGPNNAGWRAGVRRDRGLV